MLVMFVVKSGTIILSPGKGTKPPYKNAILRKTATTTITQKKKKKKTTQKLSDENIYMTYEYDKTSVNLVLCAT